MNVIEYIPIGIIRSPFKTLDGLPRQPSLDGDQAGYAEIFPEFEEGLLGIEKHSHILLMCHLHLSEEYSLELRPKRGRDRPRGVFASRSPRRPNSIGISMVRLKRVDGNRIYFQGVDLVDGTPLLDIKPPLKDYKLELRSNKEL